MLKMNSIPITVVDDFIVPVKEIIDLANEVEYWPPEGEYWPGTRSKCLSELDYYLYDVIVRGVLKLFSSEEIQRYEANIYFQKVPEEYGAGWVHQDTNLFSAVLYLNECENLEGGTTIYSIKAGEDRYNRLCSYSDSKKLLLQNQDAQGYAKQGEEHNKMYLQDIVIPGKFNRLVCFDAQCYHAASSFNRGQKGDRLTLVLFFHKVMYKDKGLPLERLRRV